MEHLPPTPFPLGWWSFDLGTYRACDGTYCLYPYASLPPISAVDETLSWLGPLDDAIDQQMAIHRRLPTATGPLGAVVAASGRLGLAIPKAFLRLMSSRELQERIPSCTACFFELGARIVACPGTPGGFIVRFLNDQQDCVLWYLYLTPSGNHCVLASTGDLESFAEAAAAGDTSNTAAILSNTWICAPSFTAFVYRFWLENTIWFKLHGDDRTPLSAVEQAYLQHYGPRHRIDG